MPGSAPGSASDSASDAPQRLDSGLVVPAALDELGRAGLVKSSVTSIRVVTWNIQFGLEIEQATRELLETGALASADVLLLQEMDEEGTAAIARALDANYAYASVAPHAQTGRDFGNAVISPWSLGLTERILLPHQGIVSGHPRSATRVEITIGGQKMLVYSAHAEISTLPLALRVQQFRAIANDIIGYRQSNTVSGVIVGGDFNTVTKRGVRALRRAFSEANLLPASAKAGPSYRRARIGIPLDHIFSSGLWPSDCNVAWSAMASDHKPLWVELSTSAPTDRENGDREHDDREHDDREHDD